MGIQEHRGDGLHTESPLLGRDPHRFDGRAAVGVIGQGVAVEGHQGQRGTRGHPVESVITESCAGVPFGKACHDIGTAQDVEQHQIVAIDPQGGDVDPGVGIRVAGPAQPEIISPCSSEVR